MRKASAELAKMKKMLLSLSQDDREKALSALSLRERQVLAIRLGLSGSLDVFELAKKLGISKIYLEQVFSLLKRARLVNSIKGSQGGYQLSRAPREITPYDILSSIELSLMEETAPAAQEKMPELDRALAACVFTPLDEAIQKTLSSVSLDDILTAIDKEKSTESLMYFI